MSKMLNKKHIKNIKTHILFFPHKFFVDKTPLFCLIITVPGDCPDLFPDAGGPVVGEDLLGLEGQPTGGAGVARGEGEPGRRGDVSNESGLGPTVFSDVQTDHRG